MAGFKKALGALIGFATIATASTAVAQENANITEYVPEDQIKQIEDEKRQGWDGTLQASATVNLVSNDNVVGQTDGLSTLVGIGFVGALDYIIKKHEIRNTLKLNEAFARTPVLDEFVKSDDVLDIESLYNYFFIKWMGAFARLNMETALFKSQQVSAEPVDYEISDINGEVVDTTTTERLPLAKSFQPLTLSESIGLFAEPVQKTQFNLSTRLGFGFRETWAQGVYVLTDNPDTDAVVEVSDISNPNSGLTIFQGGLEAFLGISGTFQEKRISYDAGGTVLIPFINNDPLDRGAGELTRVGVQASVGIAVFDWMSINYRLRLIRDPQLLDGLQTQNNLLVTFNYTFIERTEPEAPPEPTEAEKAAEEAAQRAADAEKRAAAAEARNAELEKQIAEDAAATTPDTPDEPAPESPPEPQPNPDPEPTPEP